MQAEAFTLLGRACHALGQLNDAYRFYQQARCLSCAVALSFLLLPPWNGCTSGVARKPACSPSVLTTWPVSCAHNLVHPHTQATHLDAKLALPRLGLAQLNVLQNEAVNAASLLESVLVDAPQWIDALEVRCGCSLNITRALY